MELTSDCERNICLPVQGKPFGDRAIGRAVYGECVALGEGGMLVVSRPDHLEACLEETRWQVPWQHGTNHT